MEGTVLWWLASVIGCLPLLLWLLWSWNEIRFLVPLKARMGDTKIPPGHMGLPVLGELLNFLWYFKIVGRPDDFIISKQERYGAGVGMYRTHLFGSPSIIGCSSAFNKFVLQNDNLFPVRWPAPDLVGQKSLVLLNGKAHARLRSYVSNAINKPNALKKIAKLVQPRIVASLRSWAEKGQIRGIEETRKVTFENIGKMFANLEPGPVLDELNRCFAGFMKGVRAQPINLPGTAYHHALQCRKKLMVIFRAELEKKKENGSEDDNDLMDGLMRIKDEHRETLCDDEVLDNIVSLVLAGFESTSLASMWALYYLAKYPDVLQKLREENNAVSNKKRGNFITSEDLAKLKYTNKVVEETLRMANIAAFTFRLVSEDTEYKGHMLPKGWKVLVWFRCMHNDPNNFDNPMCFNPDRWNQPPKPGTYQVFGGGVRICAGDNLARLQLAIYLHHLATGFK
ncbi:hypothetical protein GIB67_032998 [Kingdonia uniflora]|uniref:Ent-kaurenoic acid oxidase n=1 Tax=Kingdonia uniflora TaxID=39325 RepID=A0A7J7MYN3_9MAGN|nr:hypothetical protein GIB67_032998 [Kingdonia uniflora]